MAYNINCCQMVGDLQLGIDGCIVSFSDNCTTEVAAVCDSPIAGPTTGTINMTALVDTEIWRGCPAKANVNIPFIRKYDCVNDKVYFIFNGEGNSSITGDAQKIVTIKNILNSNCVSIEANSSSGPASFYTVSQQINGYGMKYDGKPISFDTTKDGTIFNFEGSSYLRNNPYYLQSFSIDLSPGNFPMATYSFAYAIDGASFITTDFSYFFGNATSPVITSDPITKSTFYVRKEPL